MLPYNLVFSKRKGFEIVTAWPMALCGLSGATTTTSPKCFTASTNDLIPGAVMPSSLVINMSGLSFILVCEERFISSIKKK
jgi:hypothetical protein